MQGFNLAEAFKDPIASVAALRDILTDVSKLKLLGPESQKILMQNKDAFIALTNSAMVYEQQIVASEAKIKDLEGKMASRLNKAPIQRQITQEQQVLAETRSRLSDTRAGLTAMAQEFAKASEGSIKRGFEAIERSFVKAMADSVLTSQKALVDMLPKTASTIDLSVRLENQKLELQKQEIVETQRLIKELELGRLSAEKLSLEERRDKALQVPGLDNSIRNKIQEAPAQRLKEIEERTKVLTSTNISRDVNEGKLQRTPETLAALQQQQGAFAKVAAIASQQQMNLVKAEVDKINAFYVTTKRTLDNDLRAVQAERDLYLRGEGFRQDSLEQQQATLAGFTAQEASITRQLGLLDSQRELATASRIQVEAQTRNWKDIIPVAGQAVDIAKTQLNTSARILDITAETNKAETDRKNILDQQLQTIKLQTIDLDTRAKLSKIQTDTELSLINIQKEELQMQLDRGTITVDSYNQQLFALEKIERVKQRDAKLSQLLSQYTLDMIGYSKEFASATAAQIPEIRARADQTNALYQAEVSGIERVFERTEKLKEEQKALSSRQMAYADLFKQAFKGMEDAIVEFTKTGKLSFKSMIESFLEGLLRYELEQQRIMLLQSVGGTRGIAGVFMNAIGLGNRGFGTGSNFGNQDYGQYFAKGGAFDYGIPAFAKGGAFTNQIVDSPTLFKFARGTGLMGEAGPEAIMPLKRDSNGNLGVRAQGGSSNVEVVVNNYSTAQAETRETTDSRGNRRIEVIVGDMVAQEVSKTGSATQNAFSSTYGTRPALARR
jgi:phage-related minor tail protein